MPRSAHPGLGRPFHWSFARDSDPGLPGAAAAKGGSVTAGQLPELEVCPKSCPSSSKSLVGGGTPCSVASTVASSSGGG